MRQEETSVTDRREWLKASIRYGALGGLAIVSACLAVRRRGVPVRDGRPPVRPASCFRAVTCPRRQSVRNTRSSKGARRNVWRTIGGSASFPGRFDARGRRGDAFLPPPVSSRDDMVVPRRRVGRSIRTSVLAAAIAPPTVCWTSRRSSVCSVSTCAATAISAPATSIRITRTSTRPPRTSSVRPVP